VLHSSTVILLTNPAHQTALNMRRRLVDQGLLSAHGELVFTRLLLQSSKECSKASILWYYRRWLFSLVDKQPHKSTHAEGNVLNETEPLSMTPLFRLSPSALFAEFDLIRRACEIYPRNYHAWSHWQLVVRDACSFLCDKATDSRLESLEMAEILRKEHTSLTKWVDLHVSDFTSMFNLCAMHRMINSTHKTSRISILEDGHQELLLKQAMDLTQAYPSHESLWMFLRESLSLQSNPKDSYQRVREDLLVAAGLSKHDYAIGFETWGARSFKNDSD
jgi:protein prenyltransferase alpha subunit repeat containing protein 1